MRRVIEYPRDPTCRSSRLPYRLRLPYVVFVVGVEAGQSLPSRTSSERARSARSTISYLHSCLPNTSDDGVSASVVRVFGSIGRRSESTL